MSLRPCGVCRVPVPEGNCPAHPRRPAGYRPNRPSVRLGTYRGPWPRVRLAVLNAAGWTCAYCRGWATTADHVVPVPKGGTNSLRNLVAACARDNTSKGGRTLAEWVASGLAPESARELLIERTRKGLPC